MIALTAPMACSARLASSQPSRKPLSSRLPLGPARGLPGAGRAQKDRSVLVRVSDEKVAQDFDGFLANMAEKFENSNNKAAVIGYSAAGLGAFVFAEWLIHLPGINVLLGFPVQLVGLLVLPWLTLRYYVDGKDATSEIGDVVTDIWEKLPGKQ